MKNKSKKIIICSVFVAILLAMIIFSFAQFSKFSLTRNLVLGNNESSSLKYQNIIQEKHFQGFLLNKYPLILLGIIIIFALITVILLKFKLLNIRSTKSTLIFLVFVIIITMGFAGGTLIVMGNLKQHSLDNFAETGKVALESKVNEMLAEFNNLEDHLNIMSTESRNLPINSPEMNNLLRINYLLTKDVTYASYRINKTGYIENMYPIDPNSLGAYIGYQDHMIEISEKKEPVISGVFDAVEGFKGVTLHNPILINNQYDGTVAYLLNLDDFFLGIKSLEKEKNHPLFLIDQNHQVIYTPETQLNLSTDFHDLNKYFGEGIVHELIENPSSYKIVEINKEKYIVQVEKFSIRNKEWVLISAQNSEGVYDSLNSTSKTIILTTLIAIIIIISFSIVLNLYQTKDLRREVNEKTKELQKFNKKLESLVKERTKELIQKSKELSKLNINLEKKVGQRTQELDQKVKDLAKTKTAILNMMEDLKESNEHLKDLDKAKSNFLNVVSHELKTPLTAIFAYLDIMEDLKGNLTQDELKAFEAIKRNSFQLKALISNILEISRIAAGKFELINTNINIKEKIRSVIENLNPLAEKKEIKLIAKIEGAPKKAITDEQRLDEVLNNLISNSIKFTNKGSITIKASVQGNFFRIDVIDTGVGIPKEKLNHLGERFYQVDAGISRKYGGTGLGLSITKQLIELQGGEMKIKSIEGKGSTFSVLLPLKPKSTPNKKETNLKKDIKSSSKSETHLKENARFSSKSETHLKGGKEMKT